MLRDQIGRSLHFDSTPIRIVSLVPSITELLFDLGLDNVIVGVTKFCVHPSDKVRSRKKIGGTKNLHLHRIEALSPDLIVANKEENRKEDVEALERKYQVYVSDIKNHDEALDFLSDMGRIFSKETEARKLKKTLSDVLVKIESFKPKNKSKVLYLIWQKPYMAAGTDTYISHMLKTMGLSNALSTWKEKGKRYPEINISDIKALEPDLILLSSEPFPFREPHAQQLEHDLNFPVRCVDGEFFSWYGTRIIHALPQNLPFLDFLSEFDR